MRMDTCAGLVCLWTLLATPVSLCVETNVAQSTTEDGIRAVLRGDYHAAARILRPLADATGQSDPVAQFFLAVMFETGQGVRPDLLRACGLFLAAAAKAHPFSEQSAAIAASMRAQLGDGAAWCVADKWQGGPPESFSLGPSHRVVFADTNVTVTQGEQETRMTILVPAGAAFLPIKHTPLTVTKPIAARRHFFEWFQWTPDAPATPSSWTLTWMLSEVVAEQWIALREERLAVVNGPTRPELHEATSRVRLRVNESGQAELTFLGGTSPRTEVIPWQGSR
jgi:hypothetical protein